MQSNLQKIFGTTRENTESFFEQFSLHFIYFLSLSKATASMCPTPVSYTHLDVYKRQGGTRGLLATCGQQRQHNQTGQKKCCR